jgi:RNA polymerase sigma-70 factor (ECF subfamily)
MEQEADLIERARQGSDDAFCQLLRLHQAQVHAYIGRYIRSKDVVEDLAQEVFLKAHLNLSSFRQESSLRVWLLGIARNETLTYLRDEERRRSRERKTLRSAVDDWLAKGIESNSSDPAEQVRRMAALEECIHHLPEHSAGLVTDVYFKGRSTGEIARQTERQVGAVSMTLLRIRQALRRCIELRLTATGAQS